MVQAAQKKTAICPHEMNASHENNDLTSNSKSPEVLLAENTLLRQLIDEMQSKQEVLNENCLLLREKVTYLEKKVDELQIKNQHIEEKNQAATAGSALNELAGCSSVNHSSSYASKADSQPVATAVKLSSQGISSNQVQRKDNPRKHTERAKPVINIRDVKAAIHKAQALNKMNEVQNLNSVHNDDGWQLQKRRRNKRFVVGGNSECSDELKTVPKFVSLHVTRMNPKTKCENLKKILEKEFPEVVCVEHDSKYPELYSSFKVTILQENFKKAWKRDIWPQGSLVSRFFMKKGVPPQTQKSFAPNT
ncbi:unnamed protein product [Brassicogethes aeneus]|uniref:Uncharacterized protein n=1 Tax=Brassicogethes aeneus TaxID=1431903 RepID=A0A9P0BDP6_BRAAE|nr:unnamed protein product [Brassicogethes aeneus]